MNQLNNKCDCSMKKPLQYFCIEKDCQFNRRLCPHCKLEHKNHELVQFQYDHNLCLFSVSNLQPQKQLIFQEAAIAQQLTVSLNKKILQDLHDFIEQWTKTFKQMIEQPLELIKMTTYQFNEEQLISMRTRICDKSNGKQQLSEIANNLRKIQKLKQKRFKSKENIRQLCNVIEKTFITRKVKLQMVLQQICDKFAKIQIEYGMNQQLHRNMKKIESLNPLQIDLKKETKASFYRPKLPLPFQPKANSRNSKREDTNKTSQKIDLKANFTKTPQKRKSVPKNPQNVKIKEKQIKPLPIRDKSKDAEILKQFGFSQDKKVEDIKELNFALQDLTQIPNQVTHFINLQKLILSYNKITKLINLDNLVNLKQLSLDGNPLVENEEFQKQITELRNRKVYVIRDRKKVK